MRATEGWLRDRMDLFERYCAPSVDRPAGRGLTWIVYVDPRARRGCSTARRPTREPAAAPHVREAVGDEEMRDDLRRSG